jgi:hypothetical protein
VGEVLGTVEAPTREAAEAAMEAFSLNAEQRRQLVVQERDESVI